MGRDKHGRSGKRKRKRTWVRGGRGIGDDGIPPPLPSSAHFQAYFVFILHLSRPPYVFFLKAPSSFLSIWSVLEGEEEEDA